MEDPFEKYYPHLIPIPGYPENPRTFLHLFESSRVSQRLNVSD